MILFALLIAAIPYGRPLHTAIWLQAARIWQLQQNGCWAATTAVPVISYMLAVTTDINIITESSWLCALAGCIGTLRFGEEAGPAELQQAQAHRVQQLTVYLTALLRRYVEGDEQGFKVGLLVSS